MFASTLTSATETTMLLIFLLDALWKNVCHVNSLWKQLNILTYALTQYLPGVSAEDVIAELEKYRVKESLWAKEWMRCNQFF